MSKFTKVIDRGRITANKFEVINLTGKEATIKDIPSNINVVGTPLDSALFNSMQEGLVFTVDTIHSIETGVDIYTIGIDGVKGENNTNGFRLVNGMKLKMKVDISNTETTTKVRISGSNYTLLKEDNGSYSQIFATELSANRYYEIIFNGSEFIIPSYNALSQSTETISGIAKIATQSEVNEGIEDTKIVTSKKLKARLDSLLAGITSTYVKLTQLATETVAGIIKISTTAQVSAGTDNSTAISPAKLFEAFANLKTTNGYQKFPNGAIIQWGLIAYNAPSNNPGDITKVNVNFPIAFPTKMSSITFSGFYDTNGDDGLECQHSCENSSKSGIVFRATRLVGSVLPGSQGNAYYIAIGY